VESLSKVDNLGLLFETPDDGYHYFNGYYDKSPLSADGKLILALRTLLLNDLPDGKNDIVEIGYFYLDEPDKFIKIDQNPAFNWQQGNMLQWRSRVNSDEFLYNAFENGCYLLKLYSLVTETFETFDAPLYSLSPLGTGYLVTNFSRHFHIRRGYSYACIQDKKALEIPDFIKFHDMETGDEELLITVDDFIGPENAGATHYLEHCMFNQFDSEKFLFLHRWKYEQSINSNLYCYNLKEKTYRLVFDSPRTTHFNWIDSDNVIVWGAVKNPLTNLRKNAFVAKYIYRLLLPVYRFFVKGNSVIGNSKLSARLTGDGYYRINVNSKQAQRVAKNIGRDGHPSAHPVLKEVLVTDYYPDKNSIASIIVSNMDSDLLISQTDLESMASLDRTPMRCDLHPKISGCGKFVFVDTLASGRRSIRMYSLNVG